MIRQAALYFPTADDARAALLPVAGRPLAFRALLTAVRAGARTVAVPATLRVPALEAAVAGSPSARAAVVWLGPGTRLRPEPTLLVPVTGLAPARAVARLVAAGPGAVFAGSRAAGAPLLVADAPLTAALAADLERGEPLADALDRALKATDAVEVAPEAWFARVTDAEGARAAEARLASDLGSPIDTPLDVALHRRLSRVVTRRAMAWALTPNQLSVASLVLGLLAVWCFWRATPASALAGLALYVAAVVVDHSDGEVARLSLTESVLGEWLDIAVDTVVHVLVVVAMGVTAQHAVGTGAVLGAIGGAGVVASAALAKFWPPATAPGASWLDRLGSRDGFYSMLLLFIAALSLAPAALPFLMIVVAFGSHTYWLARMASLVARR